MEAIKQCIDSENIEYKVFADSQTIDGVHYSHTFKMQDLDCGHIVAVIHFQSLAQAIEKYNDATKLIHL